MSLAVSYEFSVGSVRSRERRLLSRQDFEQLINSPDEASAIRFLRDRGFGDGDDMESILHSSAADMWTYIRSVAPDMELFHPFFLQNDIHNLKTTLKSVMFDCDCSDMLLSPCTIKTSELRELTEQRKFDRLPEWLSEPASQAYTLLAQTKDARLSDAVIDRAVLERLVSEGKRSGSVYLERYFITLAFYADIRIALRAARTKAQPDYLELALAECPGFDRKTVIRKALAGSEQLITYLGKVDTCGCREAIECYRSSPGELEKYADNRLIRLARELCRITTEGPEPLLGYYTACEYERRSVSIILSGIRTQTPPEKIRERLRETYG